MSNQEFEARVMKQQWWPEYIEEGVENEWYKSDGEDAFIAIGYDLMAAGIPAEGVLSILGRCHSAVRGEYGD